MELLQHKRWNSVFIFQYQIQFRFYRKSSNTVQHKGNHKKMISRYIFSKSITRIFIRWVSRVQSYLSVQYTKVLFLQQVSLLQLLRQIGQSILHPFW